jgi:hypothetical protein
VRFFFVLVLELSENKVNSQIWPRLGVLEYALFPDMLYLYQLKPGANLNKEMSKLLKRIIGLSWPLKLQPTVPTLF